MTGSTADCSLDIVWKKGLQASYLPSKHDFRDKIKLVNDSANRIILRCRMLSYYAVSDKSLRNRDLLTCSKAFKVFKYIDMKKLTVFCMQYVAIDSLLQSNIIKRLSVTTSKHLTVLAFRYCALEEKFLNNLLLFLKQRKTEKRPIEYLQLYRLYPKDLLFVDVLRVGYLLGQIALFCEKLFHTQTDTTNNHIFMHTFFTAADFISRTRPKAVVSVGIYHKNPKDRYATYNSLSEYVNVVDNPSNWNVEFLYQPFQFTY